MITTASGGRMNRRRLGVAALAAVVLASACTPRTPPIVDPGAIRFPDYVYPAVPAELGDARAGSRQEAAWRYLQAGDTRAAAREFTALAGRSGAFYPAETGLGYVLVATRRFDDALARFERALRSAPAYAPALAGRGEAFAASGRVDLAIASFEAARAADPALTDLARRIDVLRFGRLNELIAAGAKAASEGRLDDARRAYEQAMAASPESALLYRDVGVVEQRAGRLAEAESRLSRAVGLDATDARAWAALGEVREQRGALAAAAEAFERASAIEPSEEWRRALDRVRAALDLETLPAEYRAIASHAQATRGEIAALLGVRVAPWLPAGRAGAAVVLTDARAHWAARWILNVTRLGLMDAYPNHTFQPQAPVRRVDMAHVVLRVAAALGIRAPGGARSGIGDVPADHVSAEAVAVAVGTGVMPLEGGAFHPSRVLSGTDALDVVDRLERLARRRRPGASRP